MSYRGVWGWGLVLTFGCSMEVPAAPEEQAASQVTSPIIYGNQEWGSVFSPWRPGAWHEWFKELPYAYVGLPQSSASVILGNDQEFPILVTGSLYYVCEESQVEPHRYDFGSYPPMTSPNPIIVYPHTLLPASLYCVPSSSASGVYYHPIAPAGAVPFHDAYAQVGDSTNFFPNTQMRMSLATPIARSAQLDLAGNTHRTLFIRYSNSHPGRPSALVNVGIQNSDASGATAQLVKNVAFPVTATSASFDQWNVVSVRLSTPSSVQHVYVRLQMLSDEIVYIDSAWIR